VTGLIPPGKSNGTWNASPLTKSLPARPEDGNVLSHSLSAVLKVVVARVALGENVMDALGTFKVNGVPAAVNSIVCASKRMVTGCEPSPSTLNTLVNQMKLFIRIGVPLKFDVIEVCCGTHGGRMVVAVVLVVVVVVVAVV